jgi:hypothetical protein
MPALSIKTKHMDGQELKYLTSALRDLLGNAY